MMIDYNIEFRATNKLFDCLKVYAKYYVICNTTINT